MTKVFISYSHDSPEHKQNVLQISEQLRAGGLECQIDQYVNGSPPDGWPLWMEKQIEQADYVLVVCSPLYLTRFRREDEEGGRGVAFEGSIITQTLYENYCKNKKFIPVITPDCSIDHIPLTLKSFTPYFLPSGYDSLYRLLTNQPEVIPANIGLIKSMPPKNISPTHNSTITTDQLSITPSAPFSEPPLFIAPTSTEQDTINAKPELNLQSTSSSVLNRIRYHIPTSKEHVDVRQIEQNICCRGIIENRAIWIISEWGMAADSFVWVVQNKLNANSANTYLINLNNYTTREKFLIEIKELLGCSFEQLCELLSEQSHAYLIFDDIPVGELFIKGNSGIEYDLEDMVETILEYCPNLRVLLRSRRVPGETTFNIVELKSFDEPDLKTYVLAHRLGGESLSEADVISQLYRHTDGVPSRIDTALKDLEVISLSELSKINTDISGNVISSVVVPDALVRAVHAISDSPDPTLKRSFELLKTLTIFPQGEKLERIRRFHGADGFHPANARELLDRALVDSVVLTGVGTPTNKNDVVKTLVVKRPVREYVYSFLNQIEISKLNQKAISLYFGESWSSGDFKPAPEFRFEYPQRSPYEIANASIVIQRLMHEAISSGNDSQINSALRVAVFFCTALVNGSHYRSVLAFMNDFLPLIPKSRFIRIHNELKRKFANCLRMVKETERAKTILLEIKDYDFDKSTKLQILLSLALCHQILKENEDALRTSREIKKLDPKSRPAMQAESIIIELATDDPDRYKKLLTLEAAARRKGVLVVANNIALLRVEEMVDHEEIRKTIFEVISTLKSTNDAYNMTRAIVKLGKLAIGDNMSLTLYEKNLLIDAYHYLYNERISNLFNDCHNALWHMFERENDVLNLLKLFRHTSLIWRLRGLETQEQECARKLIKFLEGLPLIDDRNSEKERAYFSFRAGLLTVSKTQSTS